ncbi:MAG: hypothetical protein CVU84_09335 [Firmicutes bacterium HGW-Firmicutes-1]|jgi:two-component system response regulator YesN|nr:MAG: hypothetical protein CVU84_09335 [Firmicutes bacterium HGW-Firmicutes-1]
MHKVLIVDDEYLMRKALRIVISETEGFQIVGEAESGLQALKLSEELVPDIIFMDIKIPTINGLEVSQVIKKRAPNTSIIVLTAHSDFQYAQTAIQIGIDEYLLKPCSFEKIRELLNKYKQNHVTKSSHSAELIKHLSEKDFEKTYEKINKVVGYIFKQTQDPNLIYRELKEMLAQCLDLIACMDKDYRDSYEKKFQINEAICKDVVLAEFWVFDLLDEVFKQRSIQNYPQLIKVFTYLENNIKKDVSLQSAATYSELSLSYLSRLFKKEFGINFTNYISIKKVRKSKKLLKESDIGIADVAFEFGYNESSYFCKVFKGIEGITPTQYRENLKK